MTKTDFIDSFSSTGIHRRNFIKIIGAGGAGAAMIGAGISPLGPIAAQAQTSPPLSRYTEQLPVPGIVNAKGGGAFSLPGSVCEKSFLKLIRAPRGCAA